jgi:hypothetical protein
MATLGDDRVDAISERRGRAGITEGRSPYREMSVTHDGSMQLRKHDAQIKPVHRRGSYCQVELRLSHSRILGAGNDELSARTSPLKAGRECATRLDRHNLGTGLEQPHCGLTCARTQLDHTHTGPQHLELSHPVPQCFRIRRSRPLVSLGEIIEVQGVDHITDTRREHWSTSSPPATSAARPAAASAAAAELCQSRQNSLPSGSVITMKPALIGGAGS